MKKYRRLVILPNLRYKTDTVQPRHSIGEFVRLSGGNALNSKGYIISVFGLNAALEMFIGPEPKYENGTRHLYP
jgi:hypothetical protein